MSLKHSTENCLKALFRTVALETSMYSTICTIFNHYFEKQTGFLSAVKINLGFSLAKNDTLITKFDQNEHLN